MKDCFDVTTDVRGLLNVPSITNLLGPNGNIYQTERPSGRANMTDLVINCLGVTNEALQKGSGNINAYAPAIVSNTVKLADQLRLSALAKAIIPLIDAQYKSSFQTWLDEVPTVMQDTDGSYFVNIPFEYQSVQTEFKNI
jgi:hypothetical protein